MRNIILLIFIVSQLLSCSHKIEDIPNVYVDYVKSVNNKYLNQDFNGAIEIINKAIVLFPDKAASWISWRALCKEYLKDYNGAIADYNKLMEMNPQDAGNYYARGRIKALMKEYTEAILDFTKSIAMDTSRLEPYFERGNAKYELKEYQEAINDYSKAIGNDVQWLDANFNKGMAELKLGQKDSASKYFLIAKKQAISVLESGNGHINKKYFQDYCK